MIYERAMELVAALRSGKYQQAKWKLRNGNAFCCLGVACDISRLGEWDKKGDYHISTRYSNSVLPDDVQAWFGFKTNTGTFSNDTCLTEMNDNGKSFAEIADFIEANWEAL